MPGMHIRYNETALKYEYSTTGTDQGPWMTLPLINNISSGGGSNVAFTNVNNVFTSTQDFTGVTGLTYGGAPIEIATITPRIAFHWPGVVASQIGMDSSGNIRTYNNPGTATENFVAKGIYSEGGYIWPGRNDVAGSPLQASWYLGSHGAYGLYTNTGLHALGPFYDYGRATGIGNWIDYTFAAYNLISTGTVLRARYALVGHTLIWQFAFQNFVPNAMKDWPIYLPNYWTLKGFQGGALGYSYRSAGVNLGEQAGASWSGTDGANYILAHMIIGNWEGNCHIYTTIVCEIN